MVVSCEQVWQEVSNYLEHDVSPELRYAIEEHVKACQRCTAVIAGTGNVMRLYSDERIGELPLGFDNRLRRRLAQVMPRPRGKFYGWAVAGAAAALVFGSVATANAPAFRQAAPRTEHAQQARNTPDGLMVVVSENGKTYHRAGCKFIHEKEKLRTMRIEQAIREGYVPCVRCMRQYLGG